MGTVADYRRAITETITASGAQAALDLDPQFAHHAAEAIRRLADTGRPFSSDDLRWTVPEPPSPGALGAVILAASKRGEIVACGWTTSRRIQAHGRAVRLWRGAGS